MYEELFAKLAIWKRRYGLTEIRFTAMMRGMTEAPAIHFTCIKGEEAVKFIISSDVVRSVVDLSSIVDITLKSKCSEFSN